MRTSALPFVIFLFTAGSAAAQVGVGVEGGAGIAGMRYVPPALVQYTSRAVVAGKLGALADIPIGRSLSLQSGVYWYSRGSSRTDSWYFDVNNNGTLHTSLRLHYGSVPLMLMDRIGRPGHARLVAGIGAEAGYLLAGKVRYSLNASDSGIASSASGTQKVANGYPVTSFDLGLSITAGCELPTGLFFRLWYTNGVQDLGSDTYPHSVYKNRSGVVSIGYILGKGRNINKEADDLIDKTDSK